MKDEILRAIEYLKKEMGMYYFCDNKLKSFNLTIDILQEQLDRLKDCEVCEHLSVCDLCKRKNVVCNTYPCMDCKYNCVEKHRGSNNNFQQRVFYCYRCGRKLKG